MELSESPMSERQRKYRETYRERIATWYNGPLHVAVIYTIGIAALYIYISHIASVVWWEWLTLPIVFLLTNVFEWVLHRYVLHRPLRFPGLKAIYTRHTLMHHQFFTDTEVRFADSGDWRVTFFPPYALVVFVLMTIPGALALSYIFTPNVGWLTMCGTTGMYLTYEFMHFCCHVDENAFVRNMPFVNTLRRHHMAHHDQSIMMERNMNLTFPISDWLFGTSDLNRGLLGHLFNGYNKKHVKTDMRRTSSKPKIQPKAAPSDAAAAMGD
jgi:hypothetical protein